MTEDIIPSAIFCTDEVYEKHIRDTIAMLDGVVLRGEDLLVENGLSTRILLDFYWETLRRTIEYGRQTEEKEEEGKRSRGCSDRPK